MEAEEGGLGHWGVVWEDDSSTPDSTSTSSEYPLPPPTQEAGTAADSGGISVPHADVQLEPPAPLDLDHAAWIQGPELDAKGMIGGVPSKATSDTAGVATLEHLNLPSPSESSGDHDQDVQPKRKRYEDAASAGSHNLAWTDVLDILRGNSQLVAAVRNRPSICEPCGHAQIFVERPRVRRKGSSDKWLNSGGKKGSTVHWLNDELGIRKRYGSWTSHNNGKRKRFEEYSLIFNKANPTDDATVTMYVLAGEGKNTAAPLLVSEGSRALASQSMYSIAPNIAALDLHAIDRPGAKFLSFMVDHPDGGTTEVGSMIRRGKGVALQAEEGGDFAEWHQRLRGEAAFSEGDVVGFVGQSGEISRKTVGAYMIGVISRRAVVQGSAPPENEQHGYDTVAYTGLVPVKVLRTNDSAAPKMGDVLVPSGLEDGSAVLSDKSAQSQPRVAVVLKGCDWTVPCCRHTDGSNAEGSMQLVMASVVPPTETTVEKRGHGAQGARLTAIALLGLVFLLGVLFAVSFVRNAKGRSAGTSNSLVPRDERTAPRWPGAELPSALTLQHHSSTDFVPWRSHTIGDTYRPTLTGSLEEPARWYTFGGVYTRTAQHCGGLPVYKKNGLACLPYTSPLGPGAHRAPPINMDTSPCVPSFLYRRSLPLPAADVPACAAAAADLGLQLGVPPAGSGNTERYEASGSGSLAGSSGTYQRAPRPFAGNYSARGCYYYLHGPYTGVAFFSFGTCDLDLGVQQSIPYRSTATSNELSGYWTVGIGSAADRTRVDCIADCHQPAVLESRAVPDNLLPADGGQKRWRAGCENGDVDPKWCFGHWFECSTEPGAMCAAVTTQSLCSECSAKPWRDRQKRKCLSSQIPGACTSGRWQDPLELDWLGTGKDTGQCKRSHVGRFADTEAVSQAGALGYPSANATIDGSSVLWRTHAELHSLREGSSFAVNKGLVQENDCAIFCSQCNNITVRDYSRDLPDANWVDTLHSWRLTADDGLRSNHDSG